MIWLRRFGLFLARWGGWVPAEPDHSACHITETAMEGWMIAAQERAQAADLRAAAAEAARAAFEEAYRRGETARQRAEMAAHAALVEQERAAGALRAYTAPNLAPLLFHRAKQLVTEQAKNYGVSGEAKRHQVYARLRKEFSQDPHRDVGLAIELALR